MGDVWRPQMSSPLGDVSGAAKTKHTVERKGWGSLLAALDFPPMGRRLRGVGDEHMGDVSRAAKSEWSLGFPPMGRRLRGV